MDTETQVLIVKMIAAMEKMAKREFADSPLSNSPFEISFSIEGDGVEHAQRVCGMLQDGLGRKFAPSPVSAMIEASQYKVRIERH